LGAAGVEAAHGLAVGGEVALADGVRAVSIFPQQGGEAVGKGGAFGNEPIQVRRFDCCVAQGVDRVCALHVGE